VGFEEFFQKEYRALVGFARRLGAGPADAEDAVQTAFAHLLIAWPNVDDPAAWTRTVVTRQVRHNQGRRRTRTMDGFEPMADVERAEPDESDRVLGLLRRLPCAEMTVATRRIAEAILRPRTASRRRRTGLGRFR
jgi:DNA-directed RNA polymerase specialized sigma24 family protein